MTTRHPEIQHSGPPRAENAWLVRAWAGVVLIPVFFAIAFAVGYAAYSVFGYDAGAGDAPGWVVLVSSVIVLLVLYIPCAVAVVYGRRCVKAGDRRGLPPMLLGGLAAFGALALTVITEVGDAVRG